MGTYRRIRALALTAAPLAMMSGSLLAADEGVASSAADALVLQPSSSWKAGFTGDACVLLRNFGSDASAVSLTFVQTGFGPDFQFQASGQPMALAKDPQPLSYRWLPDAYARSSRTALGGLSADGTPVLLFDGTFAEAREPEPESSEIRMIRGQAATREYLASLEDKAKSDTPRSADITALELGGALSRPVTLDLGSMNSALIALKNCQSQLAASWGFDPVELNGLTQRTYPEASPALWVSTSDFPQAILQRGLKQDASVRFRLRINPQGKVESCTVTEPSEEPQLNELTCKLVSKRARFVPALDRGGQPATDLYNSTVRWKTPK